jgi:sulfate/thiosulfate transport system ATP-binding protein
MREDFTRHVSRFTYHAWSVNMSIILTNLVKYFGPNLVVNNVSLEVADGELFVLLGGSGSGKSTILRLIAGLIQPDNGRIQLNGRDVTYLPAQARDTGFVFQNYSIFRHMTVSENVEFGLRIRGVTIEEKRQRSAELLDLVGLAGLGSRYADQLSGGQQQRVALARALAYNPAVLLLDEPFGALDVKIRAQLRRSLRDIQERLNVTTILVTHDQEEAFELADRIGLIHRGRLVEVGPPQTLYHRPQTEFTATFVGGGNVLVGRREGKQIRLGQAALPLPATAPPHDEGAPVRILFRPETAVAQPHPFQPDQTDIFPLGSGVIREQLFTGPMQRLVLAVEALRGSRQLVPEPVYGQRLTRVEVAQPSQHQDGMTLAVGQQLWLGVRQFHVLSPTGLKLLIYADRSAAGAAAAAFGCLLAQAAGGPATLLALAQNSDEATAVTQQLNQAALSWLPCLPLLETRIRQGGLNEIWQEAQEGDYEIVVMGQKPDGMVVEGGEITAVVRQLLFSLGVSILFATAPRRQVARILICTAAGEPGKRDVSFGGRVARRTGAEATVLHVLTPQSGDVVRTRAERHLQEAQASLTALGVRSRVELQEGDPVAQMVATAVDYDLLVIGAPTPPARQQLVWPELTGQLVARAACPVLVVPML